MRIGITMTTVSMVTTLAAAALAHDGPEPHPKKEREKVILGGAGRPASELPPARSDQDPVPEPPRPVRVENPGLVKQAGIGSEVAYARAGVMELGGSAGFGGAANYQRFELSPSIGYFVSDNVELSLLGAFNYFSVDSVGTTPGTSATDWRVILEPSYHMPFSKTFFLFGGLGAGVNYLTESDVGFAWQPRIGAQVLVGRSGVLTTALSMTSSTVEALRTPAGPLLAVQRMYGVNVGYTTMW